ncbi:MAG: hypothetical protein LBV06_05065 [Propionibacteriaceae bacterium]|jgi:formamidopyrimidine-DNA glycosylase|nr:hypothetical protein [Propionibacteriaceae bacterium]
MIEIPEAQVLSRQLRETLDGKTIVRAVAAASPHGYTWYFGEPSSYPERLEGRQITGSAAHGGQAELWAEDTRVVFSDGVNLRYYAPGEKRPARHQLLVVFDDESAICCTVQMYGGLLAFEAGTNSNPLYVGALVKPSPLSNDFTKEYFESLVDDRAARLPAKLFLATQQRIPGLGNGVLQDILWQAKIHPKRTMFTLSEAEMDALHAAIRSVLTQMTAEGGRSVERDLFGKAGGYQTVMCRLTFDTACPRCGAPIQRLEYRGGTVYVCSNCQKLH